MKNKFKSLNYLIKSNPKQMSDIKKILKSLEVLRDMFEDRKYDFDMKVYSEEDLDAMYSIQENSSNGAIFEIPVSDTIRIIFHMKSKYMKADLERFLKGEYESSKIKHFIMVFKEKINSNNEKNIQNLISLYSDNTTPKVETFEINNLLFNITRHEYVPKHELLSKDEAQQVFDKYSIKNKSQLPVLHRTDPVAKYYDFRPGDLIKIYRSSTAVGECITYRYCV
jgi:DNA-directed RNA polymerase I, II, and III subunit RPABC1